MDIIELLFTVIMMFLLMIPGFILKKTGLVGDGFGKGVSNLVLYIAQPVLVFMAYVMPFQMELLLNSLWVLLFSFVAHFVFFGVSMLFFGSAEDGKRRMLRFATIFSNAAFMGIPLIDAIFTGGPEVLYASIYNITFNIFLWTLGVRICTQNRDIDGDGVCDGAEIRKHDGISPLLVLYHPVTIAAALGLIMFLTPLSDYFSAGNVIYDTLVYIKGLVAPLSMLVIGIRLADVNLKGFFTDKHFYLFALLRHLALPAAVVGIMRLMALFLPISADVITVVAILASTPAASSAVMFAERYDCDALYTSKVVAVSTILSIATMPLVIFLAGLGLA